MDSEPAFPIAHGEVECPQCAWTVRHGANGLTKREWFAGQALAGLTASNAVLNEASWRGEPAAAIADRAVAYADALITALEKP